MEFKETRMYQFKETIMCQSLNSYVPVTEPFSQQVCLPVPAKANQCGWVMLTLA